MKTVTTYFFILMVIPATVAVGGELLTNPGFESGLTGWSVSSSNGWPDTSTTAHSGAKSALFTVYDTTSPYSAYVLATQSIAYDGSSEYTLSVYARDNWSTGSGIMANAVTLKIEYYNSSSTLLRTDQQSYSLSKDYQWYQYILTGTGIPAGTAIIKPVIGTTQTDQWGKSILFDDASLTGQSAPPQPHTGDLNNDLQVNFVDFALLASVWRQTADWNDLLAITNNWLVNYSSPLTIVPSKQTVGKYDYVFFDINSVSPYSNPYNPDDIRIDITFEDPDNNQIILPCFYVSGNSAASCWQGRFTPRKAGQYSYQASVFVSGALEGLSDVLYLTVADSNNDGFIHLNPQSDYSFLRDSGKPFRGIGENVAWDPRPQYDPTTYTCEYMFPLLGTNGCNFVRVWMCPWNMPLEWVSPGLGRYNEASAARLDTVLALAEQNGLYLMLTLDYAGIFETNPDLWGSNNYWPENPYNAANGGPCSNAAAFFSNSAAKEIYKKRLRYLIARWGYNPHLCVIELFNEIDLAYEDGDANIPASDIVSWHNEMSTYLKGIDPFGHLVSTSAGYKYIPGLWNVSSLDFSQTHPYGSTDNIYSTIVSFTTTYNKPYVAGEFGYGWQGPGVDGTQSNYERELHMGLWRGMFSPTPILPLTWWWDSFAGWNDWNIFNTAAVYFSTMISDNNDVLQALSVNAGTGIETMAVQTTDKMFVWLRNNTSSTLGSSMLTISNLQNGTYEVIYYDTWLGTYSTPALISVTTGVLQSQIPSLTVDKDIACQIVKISP
jgi:hypothetical protein